jgi:hypothetical protein
MFEDAAICGTKGRQIELFQTNLKVRIRSRPMSLEWGLNACAKVVGT